MNFKTLPETFAVIVKPNARKSEILSWDKKKKELKVAIAARPEQNKANIELIKFTSRISGRSVAIVSGLRSKRKILKLLC